jgi:FAD/FMN-containing dehydrogenase
MNSPDPFIVRVRALLGEGGCLESAETMARYLRDWRGLFEGKARLVARPRSTAEIAALVRLCAEERVGIVPQGGNTGLVGGATPSETGTDIVLSLERMNRIRSVDPDDFSITVEAGCILADVQNAAAKVDRLFPLSLGAEGTCQIGGNLSTNAGGINVVRYGNARDLVLGLEIVLPDGSMWDDLRRVRKDNTGYPLRQLFIGAEGTLGIITAAALKLFPVSRQRATALVTVGNAQAACDLFSHFETRLGDCIVSFEYMSKPSVQLAYDLVPGTIWPFGDITADSVLVELGWTLEQPSLKDLLEATLADSMEKGFILDAVIADNEAKRLALWRIREAVVEAQRIGGASIKHDISVPIASIASFMTIADAAVRQILPETRILPFGHLGDGNLHYNLMRPPGIDDRAFLQNAEALTRAVHDIVREFGGSFSAEHGLGQLRRDEANLYKSPIERELMERIKSSFDPHRLMNPGKML